MAVVHSENSHMTTTPPLGRSVIVFNILSPCLYWVKNVPISKQDFSTIEWHETLSRQCNQIYTSHVKYQLDVNKDDFVAVLNKDGRTWDRGQVKTHFQTSSRFLYKVFLIDKGQDIQVESNKLLPLSENFSSRPKEAYQIGIYGIFPKCDEDNQRCQKGCKCSTTKYVSHLLKNYAIHFDRVVEFNGIAFGHVYLDCDDEGFVNLAEKLLEENKAVRSKRFTKDILRLYSQNVDDCLSGNPEVITNESACNGKDNYKPKVEMVQSSKEINTQNCPENGISSSDSVDRNIAFMKECKNRPVQYYPGGMLVEMPTRKKANTCQRISKMNNTIDRMRENNYSGRLSEKGRQTNNLMENTSKNEIQNTINNKIEEKSKLLSKLVELNDNKIECKLNEADNSNKLVASDAGESFKPKSFIDNNTSKIEVESSIQLHMSKFIDKIAKMKHTLENNKTNDNTVVLRTDNDESGLIEKPDILEYNGDTKSNENNCNSSDFDHSHLTKPNTKENIATAESKYKNKSLRLFDKLKNLNSKHVKNIDTLNSDKIILTDGLTNTVILGSNQNTNKEIITITEVMESNNENTEKDSTKMQVKCLNHCDLSYNEPSNTIEHKSTVESKHIKNLKFIDKIKNLNSTSQKKIETINIVQNNKSEIELSLENKDNESILNKADISTDLTKVIVLKSDENIDAKEMVPNSQPKNPATSQELLNKLKVLNSTFNNTENISTTDITDHSIADSLLSDDGNLVGLNASLSETNCSTKIEALSNSQLLDELGKNSNKLSFSQGKSLNLLEKIKHLNLFKSLDISEGSFSEKEGSLINISACNTENSEKLEKKQQMEENIDIHDSITLIKSVNYEKVEEDQLLEETIKNGDTFVNDNNRNKNSHIRLYESDLPVKEQYESEPLSLPERLKFLRRLNSNTSSNSINSPNASLNNCSLDENISGDMDSNNYFNLNSFSSSYVSDSHISFKSRTSLDLNASAMSLNLTRGSEVSFEQQNRSSIQRYLDNVDSGSVLIHGKQKYKPVKTFYEADFDEVIFKNLERYGLRDLSRIQKYGFPVIMDRQNTVMISSRRTGKSLAYIVPLLCLLLQYDYYQKLHKGNGPCAVIIVARWKRAHKVFDMCKKLLGSPCELNVQVAYVGRDELKMKASLTNGCDLLISTPRCFLRLLKEKYVTNINRMCHLVLDETDILFDTFMPEVQELVQIVKKMLTVRQSSSVDIPVHTIVLSQKWTPPLEELVLNVLQNPVICIASHLEAAIYSRVRPIAIFLKPENKTNKLFELLELKPKQQKTVVVCAKQEEVEEITLAAKTKGVDVISAHQGIPQIHCADLQQLWASKPASHEPILVCTDDVLDELAVIDAQNLIHFSLPSSKTHFSIRFSCLHNAYRNIFDPDDLKTCQVHIFIDETNDIQLPEVFWFLQRIGIKVPPSLEATVEKILEEREMNKKGVFFCENLKQFGHCWNQHTCPERHILKKEEDLCQNIPQSGQIKMTILHIHNAGHYSVRILEHSNGDIWTKLQQFYIQIGMEINNYFNNEETRRLHGFPNVGDVAGFETHTNSYQRVKVLKITKYDKNNDPSSVLVRLMDEGDILECQVMELFTLPEKLKTYPAQAVDVYTCGMLPVDLDQTWNDAIKKIVSSWIKTLSETHVASYFVGKIVLSLGSTIWLDPLECAEWLPLCDTTVEYMSMRQRLLTENLAVDNPGHIMTLYKLCEKAGISYLQSKPEHTIQIAKTPIKPQWAHLSQDDYTCVNLVAACTLDKIFVKIVGFHDRLEMLSKDIEADVTNSKYSLPPGLLNVDDFCLGRFPANGKWGRAMVVNKSDKELELFFVDYGDFADVGWDDVKKIDPELIRRLPFQTIECCLVGVEPLDGQNWEEKVTDFLFDITEIDGVDKNLYVKVCDIDLKAKVTGGRRYKILLIDTTGPTDLIINQELINQGFANLRTDEKHLLENVYVDEKSQSELKEEVDSNTFTYLGSNNNKSVENKVIKYSSNSRTEEENERINQILLDLESDNFEYIGRHLDYTNQDNVKTVKTNRNTISIEEVPDNNTIVSNIGHKVKSNTSAPTCDDKVTMSCKDHVNELNNLPELVNHGRYPNIVWHQNEQYIWIRITLTDVQKYRLVWKVRKLEFSTFHQDVFYCMNLDLYGGMASEHLYHSSKGRYIEIKLKKAVRGLMWPRLIQDKNKLPWIKTNLEQYEEVENTSIDELIDEFNLYKSDQMLDNDDDTSSTASSEAYEPDALPYDPYDPFG